MEAIRMKILLAATLLLSGCVKDPCLVYNKKGNPYLVYNNGQVKQTNILSELINEKCNK